MPITLTEEGRADPLLQGLPHIFDAYVGHKEACSTLPPNVVLLASSPACPVQMFRIGRHMYATQFHPELDLPALLDRLAVYDRHGSYLAADRDQVLADLAGTSVPEPPSILRNFTARYARP